MHPLNAATLKFITIFFLIVSASFSVAENQIPYELLRYVSHLNLDRKDLLQIQSGQTIAKALKAKKREEIAIFGIVYLKVSQEYYLSRFRNSLEFSSSDGNPQNGIFNIPPRLSDIAQLTWENNDLTEIRDCNPHKCESRLPGGSVALLQQEVDWSSKKAMQEANDLLRRLSVAYIANYQSSGDKALTSYPYKDGKTWSIKEGTYSLIKNSYYLQQNAAEAVSYLRNYPEAKEEGVENIFHWQKVSFGLQPVIRFNHVVIIPTKNSSGHLIISKMLFANHYFRDGLELRSLIPQKDKKREGFYLLAINRSHVDGMTGIKGFFIRGRAVSKSVEQLKHLLIDSKESMERDFRLQNHTN